MNNHEKFPSRTEALDAFCDKRGISRQHFEEMAITKLFEDCQKDGILDEGCIEDCLRREIVALKAELKIRRRSAGRQRRGQDKSPLSARRP